MIKKYFNTEFLKTKYSGLDGKTVIAYTEQNSSTGFPFSAKCTIEGMWFEGALSHKVSSERELQDFAKFITDVWTDARTLAPKIHQATVIP